jgi:hypothetical protein
MDHLTGEGGNNMRNKPIIFAVIGLIAVALMTGGCAGVKPSNTNFKDPVVTLDYLEVAHYWGWWYFKNTVQPTMGKAGNYGAPLDLAFVFNIENPNEYPIKLNGFKFTVAFEEFDLNTVQSTETQWIPPGKTNQLRVHAMFDGRQSLLSLLVTGGFKLQEKGMGTGAGAALKQLGTWWEAAPEFGFDIFHKEGSAIFEADGITRVVTFEGKYP